MISIVVIGNGNVAFQLIKAFLKTTSIQVVQQFGRTNKNDFKNIPFTNNIKQLKNADLYLIAIADDAIATLSKQLNLPNRLVVHTSGSVALEDLKCNARKGIFYPLQTISKSAKLKFKKIPICLEATTKEDSKLLKKVASTISRRVYNINSEERKKLHVAAVFVNNFTNHLYKIGEDICVTNNVPFKILKPLIQETAQKIQKTAPKDAQTGPAKRNDKNTITKHLKMLNANQQEIYKLLTKSIFNS